MFETYTGIIGLVSIWAVIYALRKYRDVFHPLVYFVPMILFLYVYYPLILLDVDTLHIYFSGDNLDHVQLINLLFISVFILGVIVGSARKTTVGRHKRRDDIGVKRSRRALALVGRLFAVISLVTWLYNISNVGGYYSAYSVVKGGGTAEGGYARDFFFLGIPAIGLLLLGGDRGRINKLDLILLLLVVFSFLSHGLLATRRGPTFNILVALVFSWYMVKGKRPSLVATLTGLLAGGILLLALVAMRGEIHLGSEYFQGRQNVSGGVLPTIKGHLEGYSITNEYSFGTLTILQADRLNDFFWGKRYFATIFIRPIPVSIWPTKYYDVGVPEITINAGLPDSFGISRQISGAAPGFVADVYKEFWLYGVFIVFIFGWLYGRMWHIAANRGGVWVVAYVCLSSISIHLVMQSSVQFVYKVILLILPILLAWHMYIKRKSKYRMQQFDLAKISRHKF